jgi:hypothetical protein
MIDETSFQYYVEDMRNRGFSTDNYLYPMYQDTIEYIKILTAYVQKYVAIFYPDDESVRNDPDLCCFSSYLSKHLLNTPKLDKKDVLVSVLTEFIFRATAYHHHVGNVNITGTSISMISDHLREGQLLGSIESSTVLSIISFLTAGMINGIALSQFPTMLDDFSYLMNDERARQVSQEFCRSLHELSEIINVRNADRTNRPYVFNDLNPKYIMCSVSS